MPDVESLFGVDGGAYDARFLQAWGGEALLPADDSDIRPSFSKAPAFNRRNVASLLAALINARAGPDIWLNATVTDFEIDRASGRVERVTAREIGGREISVHAENFVVASGAIEATRLLLSIDASQDGCIFRGCDALGRFFHDHISAPLADFVPNDRRRFNRAFGHRFVGTTMRNTRLELTPEAQTADGVASAYAHVAAETEPGSGFSLIRDFLLSRQRRASVADLRLLTQLLGQVPYLAKVGFWRAWRKQLYWSEEAKLRLHVVVEQVPHAANRIQLSERRDVLGMRIAAIDWRPRETESADLHVLYASLRCLLAAPPNGAAGCDRVGGRARGDRRKLPVAGSRLATFFTRRARREWEHPESDAVVDKNLCTFALQEPLGREYIGLSSSRQCQSDPYPHAS